MHNVPIGSVKNRKPNRLEPKFRFGSWIRNFGSFSVRFLDSNRIEPKLEPKLENFFKKKRRFRRFSKKKKCPKWHFFLKKNDRNGVFSLKKTTETAFFPLKKDNRNDVFSS